ncbi:MAG: glycine cleavage system protein H [Nitrospirae bacterium CG_4_9_14_3_um_filter_53_35]|nr:MAG: glycine cleavage system protein H [Nitrospirae bacterium CG2_30_53_67]PIS36235.1 MAG: glycine cleavage system protein H [Nitrospirae bacterium CG08_land_8_20_14_0_20_52_24]PIV82833.1 MAG: glycine cleavage system protein H [Nitrospirae bacterium CG17_big_fil_post_rev_8_21_14_2_50_50_9]PIW85018.1 MAG: glycine cleavage system protein H [Nitrospirae bacterium CG_4_8_14_3_um_filter_50_41]PIX85317.1 MAG: glycine cleavage system protein H [Nitrospirae bacterium CG_4_10_14_3_um_filter_53_41]PJ
MYPEDLKYSKDHTWVRVEDDEGTIGITDFAQESLGDIVYVDVPEEEDEFEAGDEMAEVESTKATSSVIAPVSGTVIEVNEDIEDSPDTINESPYGDGWIVRLKLSDPSEIKVLMDAAAYQKFLEEEGE